MRIGYIITIEVDTNDYVDTLGEINDVLQDNLSGDPTITSVRIIKFRRLQGQS